LKKGGGGGGRLAPSFPEDIQDAKKKGAPVLLVADNLQITNPVIAAALAAGDPQPVRELAERCAAAGAEAIDVNSGPLTRDPEAQMTFLV
jgi:hypothetical protein